MIQLLSTRPKKLILWFTRAWYKVINTCRVKWLHHTNVSIITVDEVSHIHSHTTHHTHTSRPLLVWLPSTRVPCLLYRLDNNFLLQHPFWYKQHLHTRFPACCFWQSPAPLCSKAARIIATVCAVLNTVLNRVKKLFRMVCYFFNNYQYLIFQMHIKW